MKTLYEQAQISTTLKRIFWEQYYDSWNMSQLSLCGSISVCVSTLQRRFSSTNLSLWPDSLTGSPSSFTVVAWKKFCVSICACKTSLLTDACFDSHSRVHLHERPLQWKQLSSCRICFLVKQPVYVNWRSAWKSAAYFFGNTSESSYVKKQYSYCHPHNLRKAKSHYSRRRGWGTRFSFLVPSVHNENVNVHKLNFTRGKILLIALGVFWNCFSKWGLFFHSPHGMIISAFKALFMFC